MNQEIWIYKRNTFKVQRRLATEREGINYDSWSPPRWCHGCTTAKYCEFL